MTFKDISNQISISSSNYEFEKKESIFQNQIERSKRKRDALLVLILIFGLSIIAIAFAYRFLKRERKKSEDLLLNILPVETALELKNSGKVQPKKHDSVTIMFCDVKNFTIISEHLSAETLVTMLDCYFSRFDLIVTQFGLEKIKTIGDAYMCAGGLHNSKINHAKDCVSAALMMVKAIEELEKEMIEKYNQSFKFRIGINSGNVVSGVVGSKKYAYDIWGDAVNTAARMEQQSEPGEINISENTFKLISDFFPTIYRGKITAKNKGELDMYFIDKKSI